jgi:hypothetical protein
MAAYEPATSLFNLLSVSFCSAQPRVPTRLERYRAGLCLSLFDPFDPRSRLPYKQTRLLAWPSLGLCALIMSVN